MAQSFDHSRKFEVFPKEDIEKSIPQRFEKIAARYPENLAVKIEDQSLTYDELNNAANCLARSIRSELGKRSEPIVLLTEQSIQAVIACLAIWKAGKIMVLIDASFPPDLISSMITQCGAGGILAQHGSIPIAQSLVKAARKAYRYRCGRVSGTSRQSRVGHLTGRSGSDQIYFRHHRNSQRSNANSS
jgi:non-ribosomal peptide synthetase component F